MIFLYIKEYDMDNNIYYVHWLGDLDYCYDNNKSDSVFKGTLEECEDWIECKIEEYDLL
jgi:hypothetical protein